VELYFLAVVFGPPATLLVIALLAGLAHRDVTDVLDWKPTRSPKREMELRSSEISQMLEAQNRYRRLRGEPERSTRYSTHTWQATNLRGAGHSQTPARTARDHDRFRPAGHDQSAALGPGHQAQSGFARPSRECQAVC
jgi:hypothetical protein